MRQCQPEWEMGELPVISTEHISPELNKKLEEAAYTPGQWPEQIRGVEEVAAYPGGFFIHLSMRRKEGEPEEITDIREWMADCYDNDLSQHQWVRIDRDGCPVDSLHAYQWE